MTKSVWDRWEPFRQMANMPVGAETMEQAVRLLYPIDGHPLTLAELEQASKLANAAYAEGGRVWGPLTTAIVSEVAGRRLLLI